MEKVSVTITTDTPIQIKVTRDSGAEGVSRLMAALKQTREREIGRKHAAEGKADG